MWAASRARPARTSASSTPSTSWTTAPARSPRCTPCRFPEKLLNAASIRRHTDAPFFENGNSRMVIEKMATTVRRSATPRAGAKPPAERRGCKRLHLGRRGRP